MEHKKKIGKSITKNSIMNLQASYEHPLKYANRITLPGRPRTRPPGRLRSRKVTPVSNRPVWNRPPRVPDAPRSSSPGYQRQVTDVKRAGRNAVATGSGAVEENAVPVRGKGKERGRFCASALLAAYSACNGDNDGLPRPKLLLCFTRPGIG